LLADVARRAGHARARIDAMRHVHLVDLAEPALRAIRRRARVGHAQVEIALADVAARARELAWPARRDAVALIAGESRRAVAVGVGLPGAVGRDAVALVRHRMHRADAFDHAGDAHRHARLARRLVERRHRNVARHADAGQDAARGRQRRIGVGDPAVAVVVLAVSDLGHRALLLHAHRRGVAGHALEARRALARGVDAGPGAGRADAGHVVDDAVAVVVDAVAHLDRLGHRAEADLGAHLAHEAADLAARAGAGVGAIGQVPRRAARMRRRVIRVRGIGPRIGGVVVDGAVAVVVGAVAHFLERPLQAGARAVARRLARAGLAGRPAGRAVGIARGQRWRRALLDAVVADADAVLVHRQGLRA